MTLLLLVNELRYTCGVTNHILLLTRELGKEKDIKLFLLCGGGNGIKRFSDINIQIIVDNKFSHENRSISSYLSAISTLKEFVKLNSVEIIHSHYHYGANIANNAIKGLNVKTIQTNHGILDTKGKLKHFLADKYIAINEHIKYYILNNKISEPNNIKLIRCGIPVPDSPSKKNFVPIRVLVASRFIRSKCIDVFIKAVSLINNPRIPNIEFLIAGEGELENELKNMNENLNANVKFLGRVTEMYELFNKSHIFVFPGHSKTEGFPAVITEAGAYNNVVISSNFNGIEFIIKNKSNGFIFQKDDYQELSLLLKDICNNYDNYLSAGLSLFQTVKTKFDLNIMVKEHIKLYQECLS